MAAESQRELVRGLVAGDEAAWRVFVRDYGRIVHAVAAAFSLQDDDRDDLLQNTCLAVVRSIGTLRDPQRLASWVYNIAYRQAVDARRRRRETLLSELPTNAPSPPAMRLNPAIPEALERAEEALRVRTALDRLGARCRALLEALYLDESHPAYKEVAAREGLQIGSIGPLRARCLDRLRRLLESHPGRKADGGAGASNTAPGTSTKRKDRRGESDSRGERKGQRS
ncbi:MAG: sigma-70 family RNA polymerase sigma factor [Candidatus Eisenbacteria bacterium]|nr:sigma-70 family RNA polymerase sigma factor [Candidatus Eisenbacteria bacterium]